MGYEEIQYKHVKGRKQYRCEWCDELIPKGERHLYRAYIFENEFKKGRMHLECEDAMDKSDWDAVSEGWIQGEQKRGKTMEEEES